jgi:hypothetical protein
MPSESKKELAERFEEWRNRVGQEELLLVQSAEARPVESQERCRNYQNQKRLVSSTGKIHTWFIAVSARGLVV